jgi:molybdopterin/thiamine biosynthesis adenylyltransferase
MRPWYERHPERLTEERQALRMLGAAVEDLPDAGDGLVRWAIELPLAALDLPDGHPFPDPLRLKATFPGSFPYLRPEVETLDEFVLPRHHHPFGKNLCLLPRRTFYWDSEALLADYLREQLPLLASRVIEEDLDAILEIEGEQPEPFTDYYQYAHPGAVFVPAEADALELPENGVLHASVPETLDGGIRAVVRAVETAGGLVSLDVPENLLRQFPRKAQIPFVRLEHALVASSGKEGLARLAEIDRPLTPRRVLTAPNGELKLGAVLFPEEAVTGYTTAWLFLAQWTPRGKGGTRRRRRAIQTHYVKAHRIGRAALLARMSGLLPLSTKTVALVGLGAVGAPIALGLARAGTGFLRIMDHDVVDAGTVMRWPMGLPTVGHPKTHVLKQIIESHYPYTSVKSEPHRIGSTGGESRPEHVIMTEFLAGADILVDASAEWGVSHLLADLAREEGIPYVRVFATPGAWGGEIAVVMPESDACWGCVYKAQQTREMRFPASAPEREGVVQPVGCADPTFTGAGFDIEPLAAETVRTVVASLLEGEERAYPALPWQVAVLSLRDEAGNPTPPTWQTYPLTRHPQCPAHGT